MSDLNEIYRMQLDGQERIREKNKIKIEKMKEITDGKWEQLEELILNSESLHPIINFIDLSKPEDWERDYEIKYNKYRLCCNITGYTKIYIDFFFNQKEQKWEQNKYFITKCLVCGEIRNSNLKEILAEAFAHYVHI